jgi:hypothetical protein
MSRRFSNSDLYEVLTKPGYLVLADRGEVQGTKPQPAVLHASVEPVQGKAFYSGRVLISITSYRRRLLDPDNLTPKWFLDSCRYSRIISDDRPEDISLQLGQEKVKTKAEERTEILIQPILIAGILDTGAVSAKK